MSGDVHNFFKERLADTAAWGSLWGLIISHLAQLNEILQTLLLITSIVAGCFSIRYHWKKTPK